MGIAADVRSANANFSVIHPQDNNQKKAFKYKFLAAFFPIDSSIQYSVVQAYYI